MAGEERIAVGEMVVRGATYSIILVRRPSVRKAEGYANFEATVGDKTITAATWESLYAALMAASRKASVKVDVPLLLLSRHLNRFVPATLTGIHQGTGKYLVRMQAWGKEEVQQLDGYGESFFRPMAAEEQAYALELLQKKEAAERDWSDWKTAHEVSIRNLYDNAIKKGVADIEAKEGAAIPAAVPE